MNKNKSGFISMALVYTFLIIFMFLMLAILRAYTEKDKYLEAINSQIDNDISTNKHSRSYLIYKLLENNSIQNYEKIKFVIPSNDEYGNGNGLFYIDNKDITDENNDGKSNRIYFFRGSVDNNFVVYNNNCYRIIRTNEDGSIRMIYTGPKQLSNNKITCFDYVLEDNINHNNAVSYFHSTFENFDSVYSNTNSIDFNYSDTFRVLNNWFTNNVENDNFDEYLSTDTFFCNNKQKVAVDSPYYKSKLIIPTFVDSNNKNIYDLNSVRNSFSLKCTESDQFIDEDRPYGILTAEDILLAGGYLTDEEDEFTGGNVGMINKKFYLYFGDQIWTSTPFYSDEENSYMVLLNSDGIMIKKDIYEDDGFYIPVISLKSDVKVKKGNGTSNNPYIID